MKVEYKEMVVMCQQSFLIKPLHGGTTKMDYSTELRSAFQEGWEVHSVHHGGMVVLDSGGASQSVVSSWMVMLVRKTE